MCLKHSKTRVAELLSSGLSLFQFHLPCGDGNLRGWLWPGASSRRHPPRLPGSCWAGPKVQTRNIYMYSISYYIYIWYVAYIYIYSIYIWLYIYMCVWYMSHTFYKQDSYEYWEVYHYFGNEYGIEMDEDRFCIFLGVTQIGTDPIWRRHWDLLQLCVFNMNQWTTDISTIAPSCTSSRTNLPVWSNYTSYLS